MAKEHFLIRYIQIIIMENVIRVKQGNNKRKPRKTVQFIQ